MENTMTFGQFAAMCENYEYSQEYYDIFKESKEIALMDIYLGSQKFVKGEGKNYNFTEGYLVESDDHTDMITTAFTEKAANVKNKILKAINTIKNTFFKFLANVFKLFLREEEKRVAILNFLIKDFDSISEETFINAVKKSKVYTEEEVDEIVKGVTSSGNSSAKSSKVVAAIIVDMATKKAWNTEGENSMPDIVLDKKQTSAGDVDNIVINASAKPYIKAALTSNVVTLKSNEAAAPYIRIIDAYDWLTNKEKSAGEIVSLIESEQSTTINIWVNKKHVDKISAVITKINKATANEPVAAEELTSTEIQDLTTLNTIFHKQTAVLMKAFNKIVMYRRTMINGLLAISKQCNALNKQNKESE